MSFSSNPWVINQKTSLLRAENDAERQISPV